MCQTRRKLISVLTDLDSFCLAIQRELHEITAVRQPSLLPVYHIYLRQTIYSTLHRIPTNSFSLSGINPSLLQTGEVPRRCWMMPNTRIITTKIPYTIFARLSSRVGVQLTKLLASKCGVLCSGTEHLKTFHSWLCHCEWPGTGVMISGLVKISGVGGSSPNERVSSYTQQVGDGLAISIIFWLNQERAYNNLQSQFLGHFRNIAISILTLMGF